MAGTYDGSIRINTKVDTKSFNTGASSIVSGLKGIAKTAAIAFSTGAIIKFGAAGVCILAGFVVKYIQSIYKQQT